MDAKCRGTICQMEVGTLFYVYGLRDWAAKACTVPGGPSRPSSDTIDLNNNNKRQPIVCPQREMRSDGQLNLLLSLWRASTTGELVSKWAASAVMLLRKHSIRQSVPVYLYWSRLNTAHAQSWQPVYNNACCIW